MNCKIIARGLFLLFLVSLLAQNALAAGMLLGQEVMWNLHRDDKESKS